MKDVKLVCFDLNGTLIKQNTWLELNKAMGVTKQEDQLLFNFWDEGIISYKEWQDVLLKIYKSRGKATKESIVKTISKYDYLPTAEEVVRYLNEKGYVTLLLTGAMDLLAEIVSKDLGIQHYKAGNTFVFDEDDYLRDIISQGEDDEVKLKQLMKVCKEQKVELDECACVGDGANDLKLFKATGRGITFSGSKIESEAWKVIDELGDLRGIL